MTSFRALRPESGSVVPVLMLLVVAFGFGAAAVQPALVRVVMLLALLVVVIGLGMRSPRGLLYSLVVWLVLLGFIRRLFDTAGNPSLGGLGDPLLLVEAAVLVVLTAVAAREGAFQRRTTLAKAVFVLCVLNLIEVVNPLQGSPLVGAAGLLFLFVPLLAFWVGRSIVDTGMLRRILVLVGVLAVGGALYGLFQEFRGFPSWDANWITSYGYTALSVGGVIRPFGPFSSSAEYASFLVIGIVIFAAALVRISVAPVAILAIGLLGLSVFYESSRGAVITGVLGLAIMWAARRRLRGSFALVVGFIGLVLLVLLAHSAGTGGGSPITSHELKGLGNPFSSQDSTVSLHFSEVVEGLKKTFEVPIGFGPGAVSRASSLLGGTAQGSDLSFTAFGVGLGIPGLVAFLVVASKGVSGAYRLAVEDRSWWSVAVLGILVVTLLSMGNGALYSVAWLSWLVLGWLDRTMLERQDEAERAEVSSTAIVVAGRGDRELQR